MCVCINIPTYIYIYIYIYIYLYLAVLRSLGLPNVTIPNPRNYVHQNTPPSPRSYSKTAGKPSHTTTGASQISNILIKNTAKHVIPKIMGPSVSESESVMGPLVSESESVDAQYASSSSASRTQTQTQTQSTHSTVSAIRSYEENAGNIRILVGYSRSVGLCSDGKEVAVLAFTHVCRIDKVYVCMYANAHVCFCVWCDFCLHDTCMYTNLWVSRSSCVIYLCSVMICSQSAQIVAIDFTS